MEVTPSDLLPDENNSTKSSGSGLIPESQPWCLTENAGNTEKVLGQDEEALTHSNTRTITTTSALDERPLLMLPSSLTPCLPLLPETDANKENITGDVVGPASLLNPDCGINGSQQPPILLQKDNLPPVPSVQDPGNSRDKLLRTIGTEERQMPSVLLLPQKHSEQAAFVADTPSTEGTQSALGSLPSLTGSAWTAASSIGFESTDQSPGRHIPALSYARVVSPGTDGPAISNGPSNTRRWGYHGETTAQTADRVRKEIAVLEENMSSTVWLRKTFGLTYDQYIEAAGQMVGDENIKAINTDDRNRVELILRDQKCAQLILQNGLVIEGQWYKAYKVAERPLKITVSKIPPFVPHSTLVEALRPFGTCSASDVENVHAYTKRRAQKHVFTYRRNVWLRIEEGKPKIPEQIVLFFAERPYTVEVSDGTSRCFACGRTGHVRARCPERSPNFAPIGARLGTPAANQTVDGRQPGQERVPAPKQATATDDAGPKKDTSGSSDKDEWTLVGGNGKGTKKVTIQPQADPPPRATQKPKKDLKTKASLRHNNHTEVVKRTRGTSAPSDQTNQCKTPLKKMTARDSTAYTILKKPEFKAQLTNSDSTGSPPPNQTEEMEDTPGPDDTDSIQGQHPNSQQHSLQGKSQSEKQKIAHIAKCYMTAKALLRRTGQMAEDPLDGMSVDEARLIFDNNQAYFISQHPLRKIKIFLEHLVDEQKSSFGTKVRRAPKRRAASIGSPSTTPRRLSIKGPGRKITKSTTRGKREMRKSAIKSSDQLLLMATEPPLGQLSTKQQLTDPAEPSPENLMLPKTASDGIYNIDPKEPPTKSGDQGVQEHKQVQSPQPPREYTEGDYRITSGHRSFQADFIRQVRIATELSLKENTQSADGIQVLQEDAQSSPQ